jgi:hypothetical protein
MNSMNETMAGINQHEVFEKAREMMQFVEDAYREGRAVHHVEQGLWQRLLQMGHCVLEAFFGLCGDGDQGERIRLPDGGEVRRLAQPHGRAYQSVFGAFELVRRVYGTREGQQIDYVPLDERLQLPPSKFSYLLQDWDQSLEVEMPYAQVNATLERILGFQQSVHSLERSQREAAGEVEAFWQEQPLPPPAEEGPLLVCSADGKGVPMRQESDAGSSGPGPGQAHKGPRPGGKKMALIGAVYTIAPFVRTPQEVLEALFREPGQRAEPLTARPKPCFKRVRAALERDEADSTEPQTQTIFSWMAQEVAQRNRAGDKRVLLLMDGQESLWNAGWEFLPDLELIEILDLLHAISYLWEAAHLFHPKTSRAASRFVKEQLQRMLNGRIATVIRSLRWQATHDQLKGKRRDDLDRICNYFANNSHRMAYDRYLAQGFPIASGVIEGACRCLVKDRMERSGMRWVLNGAQAMLGLRSIHLSGLWEEFTQFRIQRECQRLYPYAAANEDHFSQPIAA